MEPLSQRLPDNCININNPSQAKEEDPEGIWATLALLISGAMFLLDNAVLCLQYLLGTRKAQTQALNGQDKQPEPDELGVVMFVGGIWFVMSSYTLRLLLVRG
jgi:hypothetical protein